MSKKKTKKNLSDYDDSSQDFFDNDPNENSLLEEENIDNDNLSYNNFKNIKKRRKFLKINKGNFIKKTSEKNRNQIEENILGILFEDYSNKKSNNKNNNNLFNEQNNEIEKLFNENFEKEKLIEELDDEKKEKKELKDNKNLEKYIINYKENPLKEIIKKGKIKRKEDKNNLTINKEKILNEKENTLNSIEKILHQKEEQIEKLKNNFEKYFSSNNNNNKEINLNSNKKILYFKDKKYLLKIPIKLFDANDTKIILKFKRFIIKKVKHLNKNNLF